MEIISATKNHLIEYAFLMRQYISEMERRNIKPWDDNILDLLNYNERIDNQLVFIAKTNKLIVGALTLNKGDAYENGNVNWNKKINKFFVMQNIIVFPSCRNKGIGKSLLEFVEKYLGDNEYESVRLHVDESNEDALNFFKLNNYKETGVFSTTSDNCKYICFEKILMNELVS